ncbi:MAG: acetyl-CoA hydrolase/transferase family protein [[Clostridium] fimetarium]|nr:acetyl-CoA hydrolase/transferase family protein [Alistipes timonensis]MCM1405275.1 acetyl-CoA hydrolase/transferase family protein [[Clostridium] fimetarium]
MAFNFISAQEAAEHIKNGDTLGLSGFTAPGNPKIILEAVAEKAAKEHEQGREFKVNIFTGASTNDHVDGILARNNAINMRAPYQNTPDLRKRINSHDAHYFDRHLSEMAQEVRYGFYGDIDYAIIEAADVSDSGEILLGCGVGNIPTYAPMAKKIFIELNEELPKSLYGMHDIYKPLDPPRRREIPIFAPNDRIGVPTLKVDPSKIVGIVRTKAFDGVKPFTQPDEVSKRIGANVVNFLVSEYRKGRIPKEFLPLQSGVGNVANAVLNYLGEDKELPNFMMYTEVVQDSVLELLRLGKCTFASTCSMTFSDQVESQLFADLDFFHDKILLRPAEISNNPEVIRRLGVIAMNTALEADIFGNVNSTHVLGTRMMNGIGGSGDFCRNSYISIFSCPSITKEGLISNIVPQASHVDHSEHSVDILITDQGIADLRGKDPVQRAREIIDNCAHPMYRELLNDYLKIGRGGQTPLVTDAAFEFHRAFSNLGDMQKADFSKFA